jgi:probable phosphoglycerate mutase
LDDVGIAEVARLAEALAPMHPSMVVCSPLQRAVATADAIGAAAHAPVAIDRRLNDRDYGPMTGRVRTDVEREYGSVDAAPGVEPLAALQERARTAFFELVDDYGPGPLVLVSHDAFNRALLGQLDTALADVDQRTACWNELSRVGERWRVDAFDLINR